jgi:hypothetical protein
MFWLVTTNAALPWFGANHTDALVSRDSHAVTHIPGRGVRPARPSHTTACEPQLGGPDRTQISETSLYSHFSVVKHTSRGSASEVDILSHAIDFCVGNDRTFGKGLLRLRGGVVLCDEIGARGFGLCGLRVEWGELNLCLIFRISKYFQKLQLSLRRVCRVVILVWLPEQ